MVAFLVERSRHYGRKNQGRITRPAAGPRDRARRVSETFFRRTRMSPGSGDSSFPEPAVPFAVPVTAPPRCHRKRTSLFRSALGTPCPSHFGRSLLGQERVRPHLPLPAVRSTPPRASPDAGEARSEDRTCTGVAPEESAEADAAKKRRRGGGASAAPGAGPQRHEATISLPGAAAPAGGTGAFREGAAALTVTRVLANRWNIANRIPKRPRLPIALSARPAPAMPVRS
jgi:hypothetical protein